MVQTSSVTVENIGYWLGLCTVLGGKKLDVFSVCYASVRLSRF